MESEVVCAYFAKHILSVQCNNWKHRNEHNNIKYQVAENQIQTRQSDLCETEDRLLQIHISHIYQDHPYCQFPRDSGAPTAELSDPPEPRVETWSTDTPVMKLYGPLPDLLCTKALICATSKAIWAKHAPTHTHIHSLTQIHAHLHKCTCLPTA